MKIDSFDELPDLVITNIHSFCDTATAFNFSLLNKNTLKVIDLAKQLFVFKIPTTFSSDDERRFSNVLTRFQNIQTVVLHNECTDSALKIVGSCCSKLKRIIFDFTNGTDKGLTEFAKLAPSLEELRGTNFHKVSSNGLCSFIQSFCELKELKITHCGGLSGDVLNEIVKNCRKFESLTLSSCSGITLLNLESFANACRSLKSVFVFDCEDFSDSDWQKFKTSFSRLTI